jgi:hypothetical protein
MLARTIGAVATVLVLGLLSAASASANYEQVATFAGTPGELHPLGMGGFAGLNPADWSEEVQLGGVGGMAVNYTGAGGVEPGTLYAATYYPADPKSAMRVARFNPDGSFSENWTFSAAAGFKERCGPNGEPAHPVCKSRPASSIRSIDVEIDQSTGYVYLFNGEDINPGQNLIHVYSPDGSELITEFGVKAAGGEATAASPEKIHGAFWGGLAVDAVGKVYLADENFSDQRQHRLMVFEPQFPGDYEHYVYAGQGKDVASGFEAQTTTTRLPVADDAGNIYAAGGILSSIVKLDPSEPQAPPLCEFKFPKAQIRSVTVNPQNGEVFFNSLSDKKIHRLAPCKEGKFTEVGSFDFAPLRFELTAMAFNPSAQFGPGRPAGTLYGGAPGGEGGKTEAGSPPTVESSLGYAFAPPQEFPPEVKAESVEHVTAATADLGAQINPKGPPTTYVFQYITEAEYEANEAADRFAGAAESPPGGALLGEGSVTLSASTSLSELHPDTTYHYRALATSHCSAELPGKVCEGTGADQAFHTFPIEAPGLPDKRVYELVSPAEKQGGQVLAADASIGSCVNGCKPGNGYVQFPRQSRPDGGAIAYEGTPFSGEEGAIGENEYISRRDAKTGWHTVNLTPALAQPGSGSQGYRAFDVALSQGLLVQGGPALSPQAPPEYLNLYTQPTNNPLALDPLLTAEPPNRPAGGEVPFEVTYAGASADLSRIFFAANDALTAETALAPEALDPGAGKLNLYEWAEGQLRLVNVLPGNAETLPGAFSGEGSANAISTDGSRVFWSDGAGQVYVRIDGSETREVEDPGKFISASSDGSKVLLDDGCLYDVASEECEDLSADESDVHQGGFLGVAGQSDDLSHVYFVDSAALAPGTEARVCKQAPEESLRKEEEEGKVPAGFGCNLYAWSEGTIRFVAALLADDNSGEGNTHTKSWSSMLSARTAEASPNGRFLAFQSQARISGYDNTGPCRGPSELSPCTQIFLYDSATNDLRCASCNPSATRPLGWSSLRLISVGLVSRSLPQPRYLTDEGRLYFDSRDSLSPFDTNNGVEDVYQYEPSEVGGCKREGGCVSLISAGSEPNDSNFLAMDQDGKNVFFTSRDQLVLKDHDDLIDLYDTRQEGGIPAETEVARSECQGEACQPVAVAPNHLTPASASLPGSDNVDEKKTAKRHKKKHAKKRKSHKRPHGRAAGHKRGGGK